MATEIIKAVSKALDQAFSTAGGAFEIYFSEDVRQGLKEPCFFIAHVGSSQTRMIGRRHRQLNSFDVQYFPQAKGGNAEMIGVAGQLYDALEFVRLADGDLVHGTELKYDIQDGVLHFFVDYNVFLKEEAGLDGMETLEVDAAIAQEG
jgi:hypothetical protein